MRPSRNALLIQAFSGVLKARRLQLGMTQEDLAGAIDLDRPYITLMEAGTKQPTLSVLWRLAAGLQMTMSDLASIIEERLVRLQTPPTPTPATAAAAAKTSTRRRT